MILRAARVIGLKIKVPTSSNGRETRGLLIAASLDQVGITRWELVKVRDVYLYKEKNLFGVTYSML